MNISLFFIFAVNFMNAQPLRSIYDQSEDEDLSRDMRQSHRRNRNRNGCMKMMKLLHLYNMQSDGGAKMATLIPFAKKKCNNIWKRQSKHLHRNLGHIFWWFFLCCNLFWMLCNMWFTFNIMKYLIFDCNLNKNANISDVLLSKIPVGDIFSPTFIFPPPNQLYWCWWNMLMKNTFIHQYFGHEVYHQHTVCYRLHQH